MLTNQTEQTELAGQPERTPIKDALRAALSCLAFFTGTTHTRCLVCADPVPRHFLRHNQLSPLDSIPLCTDCRNSMPKRTAGFCHRCGELFRHAESPTAICSQCLVTAPPWDDFAFYGAYENQLREAVLAFKFHGRTELAPLLGSMLVTACAAFSTPDAIIPVPLHTERLRERGYNQCLELAVPLSRHFKTPILTNTVVRAIPTIQQAGLPLSERTRNVSEAFTVADPASVAGKHLLVIDDIMTSGATLRSLVKTVREAGARQVDIAVVSRTGKNW